MYPDRQAVEREVADKLTDENSFLDFYCSVVTESFASITDMSRLRREFIPEGSS
jgi:hypothetical protein